MVKRLFYNILLISAGLTFIGLTNSNDESEVRKVSVTNRSNIENNVARMIESKITSSNFKNIKLFDYSQSNDTRALNSFVRSAVFLTLNRSRLNYILDEKPDNIIFSIPGSFKTTLDLELTKVSVTKKDFNVKDEHNRLIAADDHGIHYRGIVKDQPNSIATVSIFPSFVMGLICTDHGNLVLGSILDSKNGYTQNYILYNDNDMLVKSNFKCGVENKESEFVRNFKKNESVNSAYNDDINLFKDTVGVYFEADYDMYQRAGDSVNFVYQFITGFFNSVAALYQNESIPFQISSIKVWRTVDPYANDTDSFGILYKFGANIQDNFMGDLAHLISTGHGQRLGGISWVNVLCTPYNSNDHSGRYSFSNIDPTYYPYPTYSWTVQCVTHEMGHCLGSYHTHACHWPIDPINPSIIGAIDSCYYAEGNCFSQLQANYHGTIMSYCQLFYAIDFTKGFGPLPGDTIRHWFALASCIHSNLNSSEHPVFFNLLQNYPNPFNPSTNIEFLLPESGNVYLYIYDVTGRVVSRLINGQFYDYGVYNYVFNASPGIASGIYFYKLYVIKQSREVYSQVKKMVLIK